MDEDKDTSDELLFETDFEQWLKQHGVQFEEHIAEDGHEVIISLDELKESINNLKSSAFYRGQRSGSQFDRLLKDGGDWIHKRSGFIDLLCLLIWHRPFEEVKKFPNDRAVSEITSFMKQLDAIVNKEVEERLKNEKN